MSASAARPDPTRRPMVDWYAPGQLVSTGIEVVISLVMGQRFDYRAMQDVGPDQPVFDYAAGDGEPRRELWFDYLADTGDGWNPTYAVASLVARDTLDLDGRVLEGGQFLLLGGDEVYPVASARSYRERLEQPFEAALPWSDANRHVYAIPGNHDWYDGLVSFSRRFTQERWLGGWRTRQKRSYFAIRLPHRWWLWAVDVHLESDIDLGQRDYFRRIASAHLEPDDRVILASAEPEWLQRDVKGVRESNLRFLEREVIEACGARVYVWLAGDIHHYRRYEDRGRPPRQRIVSGGGGAYLSPTHGPLFGPAPVTSRRAVEVDGTRFEEKCAWPSPATSWRLSALNLAFLVRNWRFAWVPAVVYALLTWGIGAQRLDHRLAAELLDSPARALVLGLVLLGFMLYADRERGRGFQVIAGGLHGLVHVAAALAIAAWTASWAPALFPAWPGAGQLARLVATGLVGGVVGTALVGLYLLVSCDLLGAHRDQSFAALRIQDYKHFLRLHVTADGALEIFPIGIPRVPRGNMARATYLLIEGPVRIDPAERQEEPRDDIPA